MPIDDRWERLDPSDWDAFAQFARMLSGVWKYMMTDEVWARVEALKARYAKPSHTKPEG